MKLLLGIITCDYLHRICAITAFHLILNCRYFCCAHRRLHGAPANIRGVVVSRLPLRSGAKAKRLEQRQIETARCHHSRQRSLCR